MIHKCAEKAVAVSCKQGENPDHFYYFSSLCLDLLILLIQKKEQGRESPYYR